MKKIINGKNYDTETATEIATQTNGVSYSDFRYVIEILYQKKTGEYFLYGEGGPLTKYAESAGDNSWRGGKVITPFSEKEAKIWCEMNLDVDEYEEIFGEVEE